MWQVEEIEVILRPASTSKQGEQAQTDIVEKIIYDQFNVLNGFASSFGLHY